MHHFNIRQIRMDKILQLGQAKKFKHRDLLLEEMVADWNAAMKPFYDSLDEYCDTHEENECDLRAQQIKDAKKIEHARMINMLEEKKRAKKVNFEYNSCEDHESDCGDIFDKKTRQYITDPEERRKILSAMDERSRKAIESEKPSEGTK